MIIVKQLPTASQSETAGVGIKEWLEASAGMMIVSYVGPAVPANKGEQEEPAFGTHIKETVAAFRYFFGRQ
jgi:hypothetical protein